MELNSGSRVIASTEVFLYTDKDRVVARRLLDSRFSNRITTRLLEWLTRSHQSFPKPKP